MSTKILFLLLAFFCLAVMQISAQDADAGGDDGGDDDGDAGDGATAGVAADDGEEDDGADDGGDPATSFLAKNGRGCSSVRYPIRVSRRVFFAGQFRSCSRTFYVSRCSGPCNNVNQCCRHRGLRRAIFRFRCYNRSFVIYNLNAVNCACR